MAQTLVIGKSGQLALALDDAARARGLDLIFAGRDTLDLARPETVVATLENLAPTAIVNAAAYTAVDKAEEEEELATRINSAGPAEAAKYAATCGIPFLHVSTDYVFDGQKNDPYREDDPVGPQGAYGRSKLAGETAILAANPQAMIFRTAWVYSSTGQNFLRTMLRLAQSRDVLTIVADQIGNPTYAADLADSLLDVLAHCQQQPLQSGLGGVYHLSGTGEASWADFASEIFRQTASFGHPAPTVKPIPTSDFPTPAKRPANSRLNTDKAHETFGVRLPSWQTSVETCIKRVFDAP